MRAYLLSSASSNIAEYKQKAAWDGITILRKLSRQSRSARSFGSYLYLFDSISSVCFESALLNTETPLSFFVQTTIKNMILYIQFSFSGNKSMEDIVIIHDMRLTTKMTVMAVALLITIGFFFFTSSGFAETNGQTQLYQAEQRDTKVARGFIGVLIQNISPDLKNKLGLKDTNGALVSFVAGGGPADKAGIQVGDVIKAFDGKEIKDGAELSRIVLSTTAEKNVRVDVLRKGEKKTFDVNVGERQEPEHTKQP
jgi:hypothetical protein